MGKISRKKKGLSKFVLHGKFDVIFCALVFILVCVGTVMMYSASYVFAQENEGSANAFFIKQLIFAVIGFGVMFFVSKVNYTILNNIPIVIAVTVVSVVLVVVSLVQNSGEVIKRWIYVGSITFQPSELVKFALILSLAFLICRLQSKFYTKKLLKDLVPTAFLAVVIIAFCGLVFLQSHYSCLLLLFFIGISMMWVGGVDKRWYILLFIAILVGAFFIFIQVNGKELDEINYAAVRIKAWLDKPDYKPAGERTADDWSLIQNQRYQTIQGLRAIGSGGLSGVGFTQSKQKYLYIPEPQNDFVFTVVCEELGLIGAAIIIFLFVFLIYRGLKIAVNNRNMFGSLLVIGIMLQVGIQVFLNIAVVTDLVPNTGIGLPFFSYGGSALVIILAEMGVVLGVSRTGKIEKK